MRITLITLYDNYCYGARMLSAYLQSKGHLVELIVFKNFKVPFIPYEDQKSMEYFRRKDTLFVEREDIGGLTFCPLVDKVSEREKELLLEKINTFSPDVIGFSLTSIDLKLAEELTSNIKKAFPQIPVIWGGIHPTSSPVHSIKYADVVCLGEGEEALLEFVENPKRKDIRNLWFKDKKGNIIKNPVRPLIENLDSLPFASYGDNEYVIDHNSCTKKDESDKDYFRSFVILMSQRGCPFSCTYCLHDKVRDLYRGQRYIRRRSVDNFLQEVELRVKKFNHNDLFFWDEIFIKDAEWIHEFSIKYPQRLSLLFGGYAYPKMSTKEMFHDLKKAGMHYAGFGVQSGSERILKIYNRNYDLDDLNNTTKLAKEEDIHVCYDILSNNPFESEEDLKKTLNYIFQLTQPSGYIIFRLRFFPNLAINSSDKVRHNLPEKTFLFWNYLYFLALERMLPEKEILDMTEDTELKNNPEILIKKVIELKRKKDGKVVGYDEPEKQYYKQFIQDSKNNKNLRGIIDRIRRKFSFVKKIF